MTTTNGNVNGVNGTSRKGLDIIVIGGGIGGLCAAISLRSQGHHVEVYEQSHLGNEVGAAIHMMPNATGVLKQLGVDPLDSGAVNLMQSRFFSANNEILRESPNNDACRWQNPWLLAHRAHLHDQLKRKATAAEGPGKPVTLILNSRVTSVDADSATIWLENGATKSADVLIGADGVHSKSRLGLGSIAVQPFKGKHNAFRFIIPREIALADPDTAPLAQVEGSMDIWYSEDRKIVLYPTTFNKLLNFVCIHPARLSESSNDYQRAGSKQRLLEVYSDFHPSVIKLLTKVDSTEVKIYPLFDMATLPTFVKRRLALIGDAAHPFTPHLAQGGAMAIEDGACLGVFLDSKTIPTEVPERLQLYNKARHDRASLIQEFSRIVGSDGTNHDTSRGHNLKVHEYIEYGFSHDEIHASIQLLREHQWKQASTSLRWTNPKVFGPLPSPPQEVSGKEHKSPNQPTVTRTEIRFRTSATLLRNLFPSLLYSFEKTDTVAVATIALDSFQNLAWLGGHGYKQLAFCIHDVKYHGPNDKDIKGTYVPVMFVDEADAMATDREEIGLPKLFSEIQVVHGNTSLSVKMLWRGTQWAEFELKHLRKIENVTSGAKHADGGLLVHKYIPSTGNEQPDADYDVFIPNISMNQTRLSGYEASPADVRVEIRDLGAAQLPTLYPVISRLAELPILEVLDAIIIEYQGVSPLSTAQRLN